AKVLMLISAMAVTMAAPAAAQVRAGLAAQLVKPAAVAKPAAKKPTKPESAATGAPVPGNPDYKPDLAQTAPPPPPPQLPPAVWDLVSAEDLLAYIQQVGKDGL